MKCFHSMLARLVTISVIVIGTRDLLAQQKPAIVVALASVQEQMADLRYVAQAAGAPQTAGLVEFMSAQYTQVLDQQKPGGAAVWLADDGRPTIVGFLPVKNMNLLRDLVAQQFGRVQDHDNGVLELPTPGPVYVKSVGAYAYVSNAVENLTNVPQDPSVYLQGIDTKNNLTVVVNVQAIPQSLKDMFLEFLQQAYSFAAEQAENQAERATLQNFSTMVVDQWRLLLKEADSFSVNLNIDATAQAVLLDFNSVALPNTNLAEQLKGLRGRSDFLGFYQPNAAAAGVFSQTLSQASLAQTKQILDNFRNAILAGIAEDTESDEQEKSRTRDMASELFKIADQTIGGGTLDFGMLVTLDGDSPRVVAGGRVADGPAIKASVDRLLEIVKEDGEVEEVKLEPNAATVGDVSFTRYVISTSDEEMTAIFGNTIELGVGVGPKTCVLTLGKGSVDLGKQVLESSMQQGTSATVNQLYVSLGPILDFVSKVDEDLKDNPSLEAARAAVARSGGKDRIVYQLTTIPNGVRTRLAVEEGIIGAIGAAITSAMGNGQ